MSLNLTTTTDQPFIVSSEKALIAIVGLLIVVTTIHLLFIMYFLRFKAFCIWQKIILRFLTINNGQCFYYNIDTWSVAVLVVPDELFSLPYVLSKKQ